MLIALEMALLSAPHDFFLPLCGCNKSIEKRTNPKQYAHGWLIKVRLFPAVEVEDICTLSIYTLSSIQNPHGNPAVYTRKCTESSEIILSSGIIFLPESTLTKINQMLNNQTVCVHLPLYIYIYPANPVILQETIKYRWLNGNVDVVIFTIQTMFQTIQTVFNRT